MALSLKSRLGKVRAMSLAEMAARTAYAARLARERRRIRTAVPAGSFEPANRPDICRELVEAHRRRPRPAFFASLARAEEMRRLFSGTGPYAQQAAESRSAAADARNHEFHFFGRRFVYGERIDWHADPVSGRQWPRVFHADVPIHRGDAIGDVKYVWELNRHQFLIDLGKAHWLFDDRAAAAAVYRLVGDWIAENPYGIGVNWACALEPAFRAWSWLWAYQYCLDDPNLDDDFHARWLGGFMEHGHFLYRHLEHYVSPYNHLIGEASALYALGLLFPDMPEASRWRRRGRRMLLAALPAQFHPDGGSVEQSTFYHHATLGSYILASLLADATDDPFPSEVHRALERGIEFSMALMQPDGRLPSIGGADDGKCVRFERLPFWNFRPFQAFGAAYYGRADFRFAAGEFFEDALWLLGPEGRSRFESIEPVAPAPVAAMPSSGYYVVRTEWSAAADYLCFDCGEQAAGLRRDDVPSAAHGHADCLSIVLWLRGRPVLVDPGFYCYNGDPAWEVHFRRTGAHNTARIDGRDQSCHVDKMAWARAFTPRAEAWLPFVHGGAAGGSHDGYARTGTGVVHRRAVWLHASGYCIICDQFSGDGSHTVDLTFQLAPGSATLSDDSIVLFDHAELTWASTVEVHAQLRCGEPDPDGGWIAPSLGIRLAAPRLELRSRFRAPSATCLTLAVPRVPGEARRTIVRPVGAGRVAIGVRTDATSVEWIEAPTGHAAQSARELIASLRFWREETSAVASMTGESAHAS
jgi:hypothetical protein